MASQAFRLIETDSHLAFSHPSKEMCCLLAFFQRCNGLQNARHSKAGMMQLAELTHRRTDACIYVFPIYTVVMKNTDHTLLVELHTTAAQCKQHKRRRNMNTQTNMLQRLFKLEHTVSLSCTYRRRGSHLLRPLSSWVKRMTCKCCGSH